MVGVRGRRSNLGRKKNKKCSESVYVDDFELINLWHAVSIFFMFPAINYQSYYPPSKSTSETMIWYFSKVSSHFLKSTWVNLVISILVSGLKTVHKRGLRGLKCPRGSVSGAKGDLKTVKSFISIVFPAGPHFAALDLDSFLDIFGYLGLTTNYTVRTILCANIIKAIHNKPFSPSIL